MQTIMEQATRAALGMMRDAKSSPNQNQHRQILDRFAAVWWDGEQFSAALNCRGMAEVERSGTHQEIAAIVADFLGGAG